MPVTVHAKSPLIVPLDVRFFDRLIFMEPPFILCLPYYTREELLTYLVLWSG